MTGPAMPDHGARLDVRGLRKIYTGRGEPVEAIEELSFEVRAGELVCVAGDPEFARLRTHVYELVRAAKRGARTLADAHIAHSAAVAPANDGDVTADHVAHKVI